MLERLHRGWQLPAPAGEMPTSWVLFQGRGYRVGAIRIPQGHPRWHRESAIPGWPVLLFPRCAIRLAPVHGEGGIIDPGCAMFLGSEELYRREAVVEDVERTDWFSFSPEFLARMAPDLDPAGLFAPGRPLRFAIDAHDFALQRRAFRGTLEGSLPDEFLIEETICRMLAAFVQARNEAGSAHVNAARKRLAEDVRALVAASFEEAQQLAELADAARVTPSHLCRVFKEVTGGTIHAYRERLRLAAALERLEDPGCDLTTLALDLGYSSHAHFATNFRRAFGTPPSVARGTAARRRSFPRGTGTRPASRPSGGGGLGLFRIAARKP